MFSLPVRILLILVMAASGSYLLARGQPSGYYLLAAAGLLVFGYFRYGPIRPAFVALQHGNTELAKNLIATIRYPNLLNRESRAYLHWINGMLESMDEGRLAFAQEQLQLALDLGVRTSNDKCVLVASLAQLAAKSDDLAHARQLLEQAESIPHRDEASAFIDELRRSFVP